MTFLGMWIAVSVAFALGLGIGGVLVSLRRDAEIEADLDAARHVARRDALRLARLADRRAAVGNGHRRRVC